MKTIDYGWLRRKNPLQIWDNIEDREQQRHKVIA